MVIEKARESARKFRLHLKKSFSTAIITALSLVTALVWQEVIRDYFEDITTLSPIQGKLISAMIITFLAALIIMILTVEETSEPEK